VRRWLASGELDLADYAVDNAIAMVENAGVDVIPVAATDYTPTELVVQSEIKSIADLRGKTLLGMLPTHRTRCHRGVFCCSRINRLLPRSEPPARYSVKAQ
jgi:hypothetical protein